MNRQAVKKALQKRGKNKKKNESEYEKLLVSEFIEMTPIKLPKTAYKDQKRLSEFLNDVSIMLNRLLRSCQNLTKLTATELVARPTYAEEFQNIRSSVHKAVTMNNDGSYSDVTSHKSDCLSA